MNPCQQTPMGTSTPEQPEFSLTVMNETSLPFTTPDENFASGDDDRQIVSVPTKDEMDLQVVSVLETIGSDGGVNVESAGGIRCDEEQIVKSETSIGNVNELEGTPALSPSTQCTVFTAQLARGTGNSTELNRISSMMPVARNSENRYAGVFDIRHRFEANSGIERMGMASNIVLTPMDSTPHGEKDQSFMAAKAEDPSVDDIPLSTESKEEVKKEKAKMASQRYRKREKERREKIKEKLEHTKAQLALSKSRAKHFAEDNDWLRKRINQIRQDRQRMWTYSVELQNEIERLRAQRFASAVGADDRHSEISDGFESLRSEEV